MSETTIAKFQKDILTISDLVLATEMRQTQAALQGLTYKAQLLDAELQRRVESNLKIAAPTTTDDQAAAAKAAADKAKADQAAQEKLAKERAAVVKNKK